MDCLIPKKEKRHQIQKAGPKRIENHGTGFSGIGRIHQVKKIQKNVQRPCCGKIYTSNTKHMGQEDTPEMTIRRKKDHIFKVLNDEDGSTLYEGSFQGCVNYVRDKRLKR